MNIQLGLYESVFPVIKILGVLSSKVFFQSSFQNMLVPWPLCNSFGVCSPDDSLCHCLFQLHLQNQHACVYLSVWTECVCVCLRACLRRALPTNTLIHQPTYMSGHIWSCNKNRGSVMSLIMHECTLHVYVYNRACVVNSGWCCLHQKAKHTHYWGWVISEALGRRAKRPFLQQIDGVWVMVRKQSLTFKNVHVSSRISVRSASPLSHTNKHAQTQGCPAFATTYPANDELITCSC